MCDPGTALAIASFAVGTASAVTNYAGQAQREKQNTASAQQATATTYAYEQNRIEQERKAAIQQQTQDEIATMQARSTARTAAGEAGVHGLSVDALLNDYYGKEGRYNDSVSQNFEMQRQNLLGEEASTQAKGQNQINSVQKPSLLATGLQIAGSGVSAAGGYLKLKNGGY